MGRERLMVQVRGSARRARHGTRAAACDTRMLFPQSLAAHAPRRIDFSRMHAGAATDAADALADGAGAAAAEGKGALLGASCAP